LETQSGLEKKLPMLSLDSKTIGSRELQKMSAKHFDSLKYSGPQIVSVNGMKRAVLVDYDQFVHFQRRFQEIFKEVFAINELLPRIQVQQGFKLKIDNLRVEISGTIQKVVSESPESSPFTELMDAMMGVAMGVFGNSVSAPASLKQAAKNKLRKKATKVEGVRARPKRNLAE
jgi:hypothetical protein